jgi:hypothetical protein
MIENVKILYEIEKIQDIARAMDYEVMRTMFEDGVVIVTFRKVLKEDEASQPTATQK